jgi:hypothetical protein
MRNILGKPVEGADFLNRELELAQLQALVGDGNHVLVTAPQRVGKTSLLLEVAERLRAEAWIALQVDAGGLAEEQLVAALGRELNEQRPSLFKKLAGPSRRFYERVNELGVWGFTVKLDGMPVASWQDAADALLQQVARERCVVIIDEIAVFIMALLRSDSPRRAEDFLRWMHRWRHEEASQVRWLLSGSVGLDTVVGRAGLSSTIGDLYVYDRLGPFARLDAEHLLEQLGEAYDMPLDAVARSRMCERIGWLAPYYLQLLFASVYEEFRPGSPPVTPDDVDGAYERLLRPTRELYFAAWEERLARQLGPPDDRRAVVLLDAVAESEAGLEVERLGALLAAEIADPGPRAEVFHYLLRILEHDGYLVRDNGRCVFRSPLLRDYWRKRREQSR